MSQLQIRLYRDSFETPWGFRLQGGKDLGQPLSVQRVFSNSPAEGELQRGDIILAIGGRDCNELTHKQALDLIKHGGGQIILVLQRPAPGQGPSPLSFKPQRPRAPALQVEKIRNHETPATEAFLKYRLERLQKLMDGGVLNATETENIQGPSSVSMAALKSAGGDPARVANLSRLGGGGVELGANYCTGPRTDQPQKSHAPAQQAPISYGFQPKKVTLSKYGGGGPQYGSDYSSHRSAVTQPVHVHTGPRSPGAHSADMLNKLQESLDTISLSPRTPDYGGYQAPSFPGSPSSGGHYVPTAVKLDMEREQEMRRQQYQRNNPPYVPTAVRIDQQLAMKGKSLSPRSPGPSPWSRQQQDQDMADGPAWKSTLKPTSVKPWDSNLDYVHGLQQAPQASSYQPWGQAQAPAAAPYNPPAAQEDDGGPRVVHLQYNSPMGLYSNQNIQDTYSGQTKALTSGALSPGAQNGGKPGERDWAQSDVYRMIHGDRPAPRAHAQPYHPQVQQQQAFAPSMDEFGTSDF